MWAYENGYHWFSDPSRLGKILAQWELFKKIEGLPGEIVEVGVFKSNSLVRWCTFRDCRGSSSSRKVVGFDVFGEFPKYGEETTCAQDDNAFIDQWEKAVGEPLKKHEVEQILTSKRFQNWELVEGMVETTIQEWLDCNPQRKIALLHLDADVYQPTIIALQQFWERLVPGGIVVIDDYNAVAGATKAVDEFVAQQKNSAPSAAVLQVKKLGLSHVPAFMVKP